MNESRVLSFTKIALAFFWVSVIMYLTVGSVQDSPLKLANKSKISLLAMMPEGWAFFTRNPREPAPYIYKKNASRWIRFNNVNFSPANLMGLKRDARALNLELDHLTKQILGNKFVDCNSEINDFLAENTIPEVIVKNTMPIRVLCGKVIVQLREPVPWAWSKSKRPVHMPSKVIMLNVNCEAEI